MEGGLAQSAWLLPMMLPAPSKSARPVQSIESTAGRTETTTCADRAFLRARLVITGKMFRLQNLQIDTPNRTSSGVG